MFSTPFSFFTKGEAVFNYLETKADCFALKKFLVSSL